MLFFFKDGSYLVWNFLFDNILLAFFKGYAVFLAELYKKKKKTWKIAKYLYQSYGLYIFSHLILRTVLWINY